MATVADVAGILKTGEPTPFRYEGALRFALRVERILSGERWDVADDAAMDLIGRALRSLRVYRPHYAEGQPLVYYDSECRYCGTPIVAEERHDGHRWAVVYCSDACMVAGNDAIQHAKRAALRAEARKGRPCKLCGTPFDAGPSGRDRYCSDACRSYAWTQSKLAYRARMRAGPRPLRAGSAEARDVLPGKLEAA